MADKDELEGANAAGDIDGTATGAVVVLPSSSVGDLFVVRAGNCAKPRRFICVSIEQLQVYIKVAAGDIQNGTLKGERSPRSFP